MMLLGPKSSSILGYLRMTKSSLCSSSSSGFRNSSSAGSLTRTGLLLWDRKHKLRQNKVPLGASIRILERGFLTSDLASISQGGLGEIGNMSSTVETSGEPVPTSAVLMVASKHIATRCRSENVAFIKCKKKDANPEKCLEKGRQVTSCVLNV